MNSYNVQLRSLREAKNLTIRESAKNIGIPLFALYLYEEGYFRPTKRARKKIEEFYQTTLSIEGMDAYPSPNNIRNNSKHTKKKLLTKRIVYGSLSLLMVLITITGSVLFTKSVNNAESYYGDTYNSLKNTIEIKGTLGHDIVTGLEYYQYEKSSDVEDASIVFYKTDNLLYFNECSYSATDMDDLMGVGRYHYIFGGPLGDNSYICNFTFGSITNGTYFSCNFIYENKPVTNISNFVVHVKGIDNITEELAINYVNVNIDDMSNYISLTMSEVLGQEVSLYNDFLPSREQGRVINNILQITGLILIIPGIVLFFIFFWIFTRLMVVNIKPRLVGTTGLIEGDKHKSLPKDINMKIGLPDYVVLVLARTLSVTSIFLMILSFVSKIGLFTLPSFFHSDDYLWSLKIILLAGIFLNHFIVLGRHKKPDALFKKIIYNLYIFLLIATMETAVIGITNAWGYDFASLIYQYLPGNVFQVIAVQYIIYLFLFFQPPFLNKDKKIIRYGWHALSLIPLGFLIASYFISNSYMLVYGVKENLYINFWFPNGFLPLSIVSTLFMYTAFIYNLYNEHKYGVRNSQIYSYGDRYTLIENGICAFYILLIGLLDLIFIHSQYGYYLGLGYNRWIFFLIPFILLVKYSPNKKQTVLLDEEIKEISRELS